MLSGKYSSVGFALEFGTGKSLSKMKVKSGLKLSLFLIVSLKYLLIIKMWKGSKDADKICHLGYCERIKWGKVMSKVLTLWNLSLEGFWRFSTEICITL